MSKKAKDGKKKTGRERANPVHARTQANPRQRKYVAGVAAGKSKRRAAKDAGYSQRVADHPGEKLDNRPGVKILFTQMLEAAGATDELLALRLREGLSATETKLATSEGEITDERELIGWSERREYLELALRLKGHLIDKHELRLVRTLEEILEASNGE